MEKLRSFHLDACPNCRAELPPGPQQVFDEAVREWMVLGRRYGQGDKPWRKMKGRDREVMHEILEKLREIADEGYAQALLGQLYHFGHGVKQNDATAAGWYLKAAAQGDANAQNNTGSMFAMGKGVPQNHVTAAGWYLKAADQGHAEAQYRLGVAYYSGEGVPRDHAKAAGWFRKAAYQGHTHAQYNLGFTYATGKGVPMDHATAAGWYHKAAVQGHAEAQFNLGVLSLFVNCAM